MSSKLRLNQSNRKLFATLVRTLFGAVMAILISALIDSLNAKAIALAPDASPSSDQVPIWVPALISTVVGLVLLRHAIITAMRAVQASNWTSVKGTITHSSLPATSAGSYGTAYQAVIVYNYPAESPESPAESSLYTGDRVAFGYGGSATGNKQAHEAIVDRLSVDSLVTVRYNPQNPEMSTLSCGINNSINAIFAFAFVWLAVAIAIPTQISWMAVVATVFVFLFVWLTSRPDQVRFSKIEVRSVPR
jgi:hypothetical protein